MRQKRRIIACLMILTAGLGLASCKFQPNAIRSDLDTASAFEFVERDSITFVRSPGESSGELKFTLKSAMNCRIEYWSEDQSFPPNITAPLVQNCPEDDNLNRSFKVDNLVAAVPYSFKIVVWPKSLDSTAAAAVIYREGRSLESVFSNSMVFSQHNRPRRSTEIATIQFKDKLNLLQIRERLINSFPISTDNPCTKGALVVNNPFSSDVKSESLAGLTDLSTDGYARGLAKVHPFNPDRLVHFSSSIESQQNWQWLFKWQNQDFNFTTLPPGFINELNLTVDNEIYKISNRSLAGASDAIELTSSNVQFEMDTLFPQDISFVTLSIRDPFNPENAIHCRYVGADRLFVIPSDSISSLKPGDYDLSAIYETVQIQYRDGANFPPWVISSQDWVHTRIVKRL